MLYLIALLTLLFAMLSMLTLVEKFPLKYLYYHFLYRKPIIWTVLLISVFWVIFPQLQASEFSFQFHEILPLCIMLLALIMTYKMHQENWFKADDFPAMTSDLESLPIDDDQEIALIEVDGISKAYPLNYVIHHHVVNDKFGDKIISLTYCAMCRSIIPFDVTDIGPLMVVSFKNANMVLGDRKTKTFFQQETFNSVIGKLHPHTLTMIPFQVLPWKEIKKLNPPPEVAIVNQYDFREFNLPIPFIWKKVKTSEFTPGLDNLDKTFPSKTQVIGTIEPSFNKSVVYLKSEVISKKVVHNSELNFTLFALGKSVIAFKNKNLKLTLTSENKIEDLESRSVWDLRGKPVSGTVSKNLKTIAIADEFWFAWKKFHKDSALVRL